MRHLLTLFFFLYALHSGLCQDRILLMNGAEWQGKLLSDSGTVLVMEVAKANGKMRQREVHKNDVFSYTPAGQQEILLYAEDPAIGDIYSVPSMRMYIKGEQDAMKYYHARPTAAAGFVLAGTAAYLTEGGVIGSMAFPMAYTIFQLAPRIKIREEFMSSPDYKYNDMYADGFEPRARTEKILTAFGSSMLGAVAGIAVYVAVHGGL